MADESYAGDVVEQSLTNVEIPNQPVNHPSPAIDPMAAMEAMMSRLLAPLQKQIEDLQTENKALRAKAEQDLIDETPNHLKSERRNLAPGEDRFARRVVVATAAADPDFVAREIPQAQGRIVDAGGLVRNTLEKVMNGGDREDA